MQRPIIALLFSLIVLGATAQDDPFFEAVDRLVAASPRMRAASAGMAAEVAELRTANNLPAPDFSFESLFGADGGRKYNACVSQGFDWPGLYSARNRVARTTVTVEAAQYASELADLRQQAAEALADVVASRQKIAALSRVRDMYAEMLDVMQREYAAGNVTVLDLNKLRIEHAEVALSVDEEQVALTQLLATLKEVSGMDNAEVIVAGVTEMPLLTLADIESYRAMAATAPGELQVLAARSSLQRDMIDVTRMEALPSVSLGYRFAYEEHQRYNGFAINFSIPLWSHRGKRRAAEARLLAAEMELDDAVVRRLAAIDRDYAIAKSLNGSIESLEQALQASDNIGLLRRAFDGGELTLTSFIQDIRYFTEAEVRLADLRARYVRAILPLQRSR